MLLKAVSSCLHARRPSRGCPGNLTSCTSQSATCQRLHSSNISSTFKKKTKQQHKEHLQCPCVELWPSGGCRYPHVHCCSLLWELWREPQQAEQASWEQGGVKHTFEEWILQKKSSVTESWGLAACSGRRGKQMIAAPLVSML